MRPISLEEKIRRCIERHPDWDNIRIANDAWVLSRMKLIGWSIGFIPKEVVPLKEKVEGGSVSTRIGNVVSFREGKPLTVQVNLPIASAASQSPAVESGLISLDKVLQRYDIRSAVLRELALIPKGKLISEAELCQRTVGADRNRFRRTVENNEAEFRPLRIKLRLDDSSDGKYFLGAAEDIAKALQIRDA